MIEALKGHTATTHSQALNKSYDVVLTATEYKRKPTNYGRIHTELNSADNEQLTLYELLEEVSKGRTWRNGIHDYPAFTEQEKAVMKHKQKHDDLTDEELKNLIKEYRATKDHKRNALQSTRLGVLDVDDMIGQANPVDIMNETGAIALYYTFSHNRMSKINIKEKRYRLLYDLSEPVTSKGQLEFVQKHLRSELLEQYPYLNNQTIGNKSHGIENLTTQFHGTNKGYEVNEHYKTVKIAELIEEHEKETNFETAMIQLEEELHKDNKQLTNPAEIIEAAHFIGDLNDILLFEKWQTLAIGLWNTAQLESIDDAVIIEALEILNGHEKGRDERYYLDFKRPLMDHTSNQASIGTFKMIAEEHGFKFKRPEQPDLQDVTELEHVKEPISINQYIGKDNYLKLLLNDDKRILLVSETGTGKTQSAIEASRELNKQNEKSFVYIALPVIALSEQTERKYGTNKAIIGTNKVNTRLEVNKAINNDTRLLIGTYNKAKEVCSYLNGYDITVIADEAQKVVSDYGYRRQPIKELFNLADDDRVRKFIGMTGTPSEIDLNTYDSVVTFKLKQPKVLADKLQFVGYNNVRHFENVTARAIEQEQSQGKKVLAIVDNKKSIDNIARALRKKKLKVATIAADNREDPKKNLKSSTYRNILENEKFDDETDILISTRVLADGINIQNTKDYVLIVAPNHSKGANFYNIDLIRQVSNRFRNQYEKIMIMLYVLDEIHFDNEHERASEKPFNLEHYYNYLLKSAKVVKTLSESEFQTNIQYFTPSIAETAAGLFRPSEADSFNFKGAYEQKQLAERGLQHDEELLHQLNELEAKMFEIDERHIRHQASKEKERYYSLYPYAFKKAITESLEVLEVESIQAHDYFLQAKSDLAAILQDIQDLALKTNEEKRNELRNVLHELIYAKLQKEYYMTGKVNESLDEWKLLKDKMNSFQYRALRNVITFLDYEQAINELEYVKKAAQVNELKKQFEAITELTLFKGFQGNQTQVTMQVFEILNDKLTGAAFHSVKERDEYIAELAKEFKIKRYAIAKRKKIFEKVFKKYFVTGISKQKKVNGKNKRETQYSVINFKHIAGQRDKSVKEIQQVYRGYRYSKKSL